MLVLIYHNFFLTINEISKEKKNQNQNKQQKAQPPKNPKIWEKEFQVSLYTQDTDHSF